MGAFNTHNPGARIYRRAGRTRPKTASRTSGATTTEYAQSGPNATTPNTAEAVAGVDESHTNTGRSCA